MTRKSRNKGPLLSQGRPRSLPLFCTDTLSLKQDSKMTARGNGIESPSAAHYVTLRWAKRTVNGQTSARGPWAHTGVDAGSLTGAAESSEGGFTGPAA